MVEQCTILGGSFNKKRPHMLIPSHIKVAFPLYFANYNTLTMDGTLHLRGIILVHLAQKTDLTASFYHK